MSDPYTATRPERWLVRLALNAAVWLLIWRAERAPYEKLIECSYRDSIRGHRVDVKFVHRVPVSELYPTPGPAS